MKRKRPKRRSRRNRGGPTLRRDGRYRRLSVQWLERRIMLAAVPFSDQLVIDGDAGGAQSVYAADLDRDGDLDLLSASLNDDTIAWYANQGSPGAPGFGPKQTIAANADGARSVHAADLDRDGDLDVLSASMFDDTLRWYANDGAGVFGTGQVITASADGASSVFAADLDRDGDLDVLSASRNDDTIAWYRNDGAGAFGPRQLISTTADAAVSVFAADLDKDGDLDVLTASFGDDTVAWYENDGAGNFGLPQVLSTSVDGATSVDVSDLDFDGDVDIISAGLNDGTIAWFENLGGPGMPGFASEQVISSTASGPWSVLVADADGDGDMDVLSALSGEASIVLYENDTNHYSAIFAPEESHVITPQADSPTSVYAADLDGDGDMDVLSASSLDDKIAWYQNDGTGGFGPQQVITTSADGAFSVYATDLDGDGDIDVLSASDRDDKIAWYANESIHRSASFGTSQTVSNQALGVVAVVAADLDGDGDLDAVSASSTDDTVAWYQNLGSGNFVPEREVVSTAADGATSLSAADLDRDGDIDLLSASRYDDTIAWYENVGDGTFMGQSVISIDAVEASDVFAADLNRDGHLDVLSAANLDNTIRWHENRGGEFALQTTDTAQGVIAQGRADDLLKIEAVHRGRMGDHDAQLVWFELRLEQSPGDPLSSAEANALIENLSIYRDDGSGQFEAAADGLVTTIYTLSLTAGRLQVELDDGDANIQVPFGTPVTFFVVAELSADATDQPVSEFRITHLTASSSLAEDREAHIPLDLEFAANTSSSLVQAGVVGDMDRDGDVDLDDVDAFVLALTDPAAYELEHGVAGSVYGDADGDGDLDVDDVDDFLDILLGSPSGSGQGSGNATADSEADPAAVDTNARFARRDAEPNRDVRRDASLVDQRLVRLPLQAHPQLPNGRVHDVVFAAAEEIVADVPPPPRQLATHGRGTQSFFPWRLGDGAAWRSEAHQQNDRLRDAVWSDQVDRHTVVRVHAPELLEAPR